jgi:anti-anti-sigma regulatory factor
MRQHDHGPVEMFASGDADLVFDFSGVGHIDLAGLSILLTARQLAHEDQRDVWVRGLPDDTWRVLYALGLQDYFRLFPQMIGPQE